MSRLRNLLFAFSVFPNLFCQTIMVEKTIFTSSKPIELHSIYKQGRQVYFSAPGKKYLKQYDISLDKVIEDRTVSDTYIKGYVRFNDIYSLVQKTDRLEIQNDITNERYVVIHPADQFSLTSITYDYSSDKFYAISNDQIMEMEITQDGIQRIDTGTFSLNSNSSYNRISNYNERVFVSLKEPDAYQTLFMIDSLSSKKLKYPINYSADNTAIEFLNDDTLFVSRNLRIGESELAMIYASNISKTEKELAHQKINDRELEQIDSIKTEAIVNALEYNQTVTRDIGEGRFSTLLKRTSSALSAMTTLNLALEVNPKSFISQKDSIFFVLGPKRTASIEAKKDSAYYARKGLSSGLIDLGDDSLVVPNDVIIRVKCLDKVTGEKPEFNIDFYDYETNTLVKSGKIAKGEVCYFSYLPKYKLGLTITSDGYLPHSIKFENTKQLVSLKQVEKLVLLQKYSETAPNAFVLNNINFKFNKSSLTPSAKRELELMYRSLPNLKLLKIEGHTDNIGTASYNLKLSRKRAASTRLFLNQLGLKNDRVVTEGLGESKPRSTNNTEKGRSENRRCEFYIN